MTRKPAAEAILELLENIAAGRTTPKEGLVVFTFWLMRVAILADTDPSIADEAKRVLEARQGRRDDGAN